MVARHGARKLREEQQYNEEGGPARPSDGKVARQ